MRLYTNELKNWESAKKAPSIFARLSGAEAAKLKKFSDAGGRKLGGYPTPTETNFSVHLCIYTNELKNWESAKKAPSIHEKCITEHTKKKERISFSSWFSRRVPWIFLFILLVLTSCASKKEPAQAPAYPVQVGTAEVKNMPIFIEALGHVDSITSVEIRSRIEGELTGIFFKQGQEVKKGDLLFTIDAKPYEAAVKEAQGALEESLANLALAEEKVKRYKILAKEEYYSQIDYETLQANFAANAALVQQNQGALDNAKINLDYCWINAPIDGMLGILNIDLGNLVASPDGSNPLIILNQMTPIFVTFSIPEFQLPHVQKALRKQELKVLAAYDKFEDETFEGELFMLDNQVDRQTGMIKLRATFENRTRELWPGQFVRTRLILSTMPNAVVIPNTAIQMTLAEPIVFVVKENNTVEERKVKLGQREGGDIIVLEGLKGGEKIVLEGQINLFNGAKIFIPKGT